jgi:hypothetical protein
MYLYTIKVAFTAFAAAFKIIDCNFYISIVIAFGVTVSLDPSGYTIFIGIKC